MDAWFNFLVGHLDRISFLHQNPLFKMMALMMLIIVLGGVLGGIFLLILRYFFLWLYFLFTKFYKSIFAKEFVFSKLIAKKINIILYIGGVLFCLDDVVVSFIRGWTSNHGLRDVASDPIYLSTNTSNFYYALIMDSITILASTAFIASLVYRAARQNVDGA